jgi:hypothetical protein
MMLCDFCGRANPRWTFKTKRFTTTINGCDVGTIDDGGWAACDPCAALIREDRREQLVKRSLAHFLEDNPSFIGDRLKSAHRMIEITQLGFFQHKLDDGVREILPPPAGSPDFSKGAN